MARISAHHKNCQSHGKILPNKFTIFNQKASELEKVEREMIFSMVYTRFGVLGIAIHTGDLTNAKEFN